MKIIKQSDYKEAVAILKNNGVLAIATDTVFGVCARVNSIDAFNKLLAVKDRPKEKAFPLMCSSLKEMEKIAALNDKDKRIIKEFMPGPLTIIVKKKDGLKEYIGEGKDTIALRMATSDLLKKIIKELGEPIFMTSANKSGEKEYKSIEEIRDKLPLVDGIVESKPNYNEASTILDLTNMKILREGPIKQEDIDNLFDSHKE